MSTRLIACLAALGCAAQTGPGSEEQKGFFCWADPEDDCAYTDNSEPIDVTTHGQGPYRIGAAHTDYCDELTLRLGEGEPTVLRVSSLGFGEAVHLSLAGANTQGGDYFLTYSCDGRAEETFSCPGSTFHVYYSQATGDGWQMRAMDGVTSELVEADTTAPVSPNRLSIMHDPASGGYVLMHMSCQYAP